MKAFINNAKEVKLFDVSMVYDYFDLLFSKENTEKFTRKLKNILTKYKIKLNYEDWSNQAYLPT